MFGEIELRLLGERLHIQEFTIYIAMENSALCIKFESLILEKPSD